MLQANLTCTVKFARDILLNILRRISMALAAGYSAVNLFGLDRVDTEFEEDENELKYIDKWLHIRPYFPTLIKWVKYAITVIEGTKRTSTSLGFSNLSELLKRTGGGNIWFNTWFPKELSSVPQFIPLAYKSWLARFKASIMETFDTLQFYFEQKVYKDKYDKLKMLFMSYERCNSTLPFTICIICLFS